MKRLSTLLLVLIFMFSLASLTGCGNEKETSNIGTTEIDMPIMGLQ